MKTKILIVSVFSLLVVSSCKNTEQNDNDKTVVERSEKKRKEKKKIFTSEKYKFSVDFASEPEVKTSSTVGPEKVGFTMFMVEDNNCGYFVAVTELSAKIADKDKLEATLDNMLESAKNSYSDMKTIIEKKIKLKGVSGREFEGTGKIENETLYYRVRIYISGKKIYQVYSIADNKNAPRKDIKKFLKSFKIL